MIEVLRERIADVRSRLGAAQLVAVTKTVSVEVVRATRELGVEHLAENRPQALWQKQAAIPDATWHLIGHLQRNKLDRTLPLCALVHSVDSLRLLQAIDDYGVKHQQPVRILLQVNCSHEEQKGGFPITEIPALADLIPTLRGVDIQGLMTMAAYDDDPEHSRPAFVELRRLRDELQTRTGLTLPHLSMGMSNDYEIAIQEGATLVRLGSVLFEGME